MIVTQQNKEQLIIGADTRKTAIYMLLGFIILCWIVLSLLTSSSFFNPSRIFPVAVGTIAVMSICMAYYFYRVFMSMTYTFDKRSKTLHMSVSTILGQKQKIYQLAHIQAVEERTTSTYAYHGHSVGTSDAYHTTKNDNYYTTLVLHFSRNKELNLVPNAAYFFLHPFNHLTDAVDNGLGKVIADFLGVSLVRQGKKLRKVS